VRAGDARRDSEDRERRIAWKERDKPGAAALLGTNLGLFAFDSEARAGQLHRKVPARFVIRHDNLGRDHNGSRVCVLRHPRPDTRRLPFYLGRDDVTKADLIPLLMLPEIRPFYRDPRFHGPAFRRKA